MSKKLKATSIQPKEPHVLRRIREILGKTQKQLGSLTGVSSELIKRIEIDGRPLAEDLASRIVSATGVHPDELRKGKQGRALDYFGRPYTPESFQQWVSMWRLYEKDEIIPIGISAESIVNLPSLCQKLGSVHPQDRLSRYLQRQLSAETARRLAKYRDGDDDVLKNKLATDLTKIIQGRNLYDKGRFSGVALSEETAAMLRRNPQGANLVRLNRLLLEDALPNEIRRHKSPRDEAERHSTMVGNLARLTLLAAVRSRKPILRAVTLDMVQKLDSIRRRYGLDEGFWAEYENSYVKVIKIESTVAELRADEEAARQFKFADSDHYKPDDVLVTEYTEEEAAIPWLWLTGPLVRRRLAGNSIEDTAQNGGKKMNPGQKNSARK